MNISEQINQSVNEMIASGKLKGMIEKNLEDALQKTVKDSINQFFVSYGDGGKAINKIIAESLVFNPEKLALPDYRQLILDNVKSRIEESMQGAGAERIKECVDRIKGNYPESINIHDVFERFFSEEFDDEDRGNEIEISVHVSPSKYNSRLVFIRFDKEHGKAEYLCEHNLVLNGDGSIYSYEKDKRSKNSEICFGQMHGFANWLFGLYAAGTKITGANDVDASDLNTYSPD